MKQALTHEVQKYRREFVHWLYTYFKYDSSQNAGIAPFELYDAYQMFYKTPNWYATDLEDFLYELGWTRYKLPLTSIVPNWNAIQELPLEFLRTLQILDWDKETQQRLLALKTLAEGGPIIQYQLMIYNKIPLEALDLFYSMCCISLKEQIPAYYLQEFTTGSNSWVNCPLQVVYTAYQVFCLFHGLIPVKMKRLKEYLIAQGHPYGTGFAQSKSGQSYVRYLAVPLESKVLTLAGKQMDELSFLSKYGFGLFVGNNGTAYTRELIPCVTATLTEDTIMGMFDSRMKRHITRITKYGTLLSKMEEEVDVTDGKEDERQSTKGQGVSGNHSGSAEDEQGDFDTSLDRLYRSSDGRPATDANGQTLRTPSEEDTYLRRYDEDEGPGTRDPESPGRYARKPAGGGNIDTDTLVSEAPSGTGTSTSSDLPRGGSKTRNSTKNTGTRSGRPAKGTSAEREVSLRDDTHNNEPVDADIVDGATDRNLRVDVSESLSGGSTNIPIGGSAAEIVRDVSPPGIEGSNRISCNIASVRKAVLDPRKVPSLVEGMKEDLKGLQTTFVSASIQPGSDLYQTMTFSVWRTRLFEVLREAGLSEAQIELWASENAIPETLGMGNMCPLFEKYYALIE